VYYITELEKQNATLKDISRKNKGLSRRNSSCIIPVSSLNFLAPKKKIIFCAPYFLLDLEEKARENQEGISALQRKISKLTKSLDDVSTMCCSLTEQWS
jgi:hypothetical protein